MPYQSDKPFLKPRAEIKVDLMDKGKYVGSILRETYGVVHWTDLEAKWRVRIVSPGFEAAFWNGNAWEIEL